MKKITIFLFTFLFLIQNLFSQIISIASARLQAVGNTVSVSGIVTNGAELGVPRYIQDGTAGIAVYSTLLSTVNRGDIITVTGILTNYQNLLELTPVNTFTVNSTGNTLPAATLLDGCRAAGMWCRF